MQGRKTSEGVPLEVHSRQVALLYALVKKYEASGPGIIDTVTQSFNNHPEVHHEPSWRADRTWVITHLFKLNHNESRRPSEEYFQLKLTTRGIASLPRRLTESQFKMANDYLAQFALPALDETYIRDSSRRNDRERRSRKVNKRASDQPSMPQLPHQQVLQEVQVPLHPSGHGEDPSRVQKEGLEIRNRQLQEERDALNDMFSSESSDALWSLTTRFHHDKKLIQHLEMEVADYQSQIRMLNRKLYEERMRQDHLSNSGSSDTIFQKLLAKTNDLLDRDRRREEIEKLLLVILGFQPRDLEEFPVRPGKSGSRDRWSGLAKQLQTNIVPLDHVVPLLPQNCKARIILDRVVGLSSDKGSSKNTSIDALLVSTEPHFLLRACIAVSLCEAVFLSSFPNVFGEGSMMLKKVFTLLAERGTPNLATELSRKTQVLHRTQNFYIAACKLVTADIFAEEGNFLQKELPAQAKLWQEQERKTLKVFFGSNARAEITYWCPRYDDTDGDIHMSALRSLFFDAIRLKLDCQATEMEFHYHILWPINGTRFDGDWMQQENEDHAQRPLSTLNQVQLCMFPALVQGIRQDPRIESGAEGLASALVYGRKFSMSFTKGSLSDACSEAEVQHYEVVQKAAVILNGF